MDNHYWENDNGGTTAAAYTSLPGNLTGVGLPYALLATLKKRLPDHIELETLSGPRRLAQQVEQGLLQCDVVLLDNSIEDPIQVSQQVHSFDKTIPVIILTTPDCSAQLRRSVMFSPLLGSEVTPWVINDIDGLLQAITNAVERHKQRRKYLDTIATVQPKLGNLTLSQPEVGHYLGRLLDQAPIGVISVDGKGCILAINRHSGLLLGTTERETIGKPLRDFFSPDSQDGLTNLLMRSSVAQVFGTKPEVLEQKHTSAQVRSLEVSATPVAYHAERRGYMVILQDVTERERAELQRKKSDELMRKLSGALEQAADSVMITDKHRVIEYVNPAFETLTGYSKEEAIGRRTYFLRSGVQDNEFFGDMWRTISSGNIFRGVLVNRKKDGKEYYEEKTITPLRNTEGDITHYVSTGHDITEQRIAEKAIREHQNELTHVSRLSTLGEMTSGLAHELNQPLCAITTYAQTCLRILDAENDNKEKLQYGMEQIVKQAEHAGEIFKRLRNFARKRVLPKRRVDMRHIINEVSNLSHPDLTTNRITLVVNEQENGRFQTFADPIQLEQVLLNLLRNSIDAVTDLPPDRKQINLDLTTTGAGDIKVALTDCGNGCPKDIEERLFEPFFTTKPKGLGIGLGISHSIIESHGGKLILEKNTPNGATFSFTLPVADCATGANTDHPVNMP